ncbi:hypothetical protein H8356DRAFT_1040281 [Neocallimastix lanati (nom. inval.)]|nr:hypothetical protein H8356DRAFT_1040281 [Neocallimastix sp. JGI-2020a]
MNSKIDKHSMKLIIYSFCMIIWYILISILAYNYGNLPFGNYFVTVLSLTQSVAIVLLIISIFTRNKSFITHCIKFISYETLQRMNYNIIIISALNFIYILAKGNLDNYKKKYSNKFDNYSNGELKKYILLNTSIMLIAEIIQLILVKKYNTYLENYSNEEKKKN